MSLCDIFNITSPTFPRIKIKKKNTTSNRFHESQNFTNTIYKTHQTFSMIYSELKSINENFSANTLKMKKSNSELPFTSHRTIIEIEKPAHTIQSRCFRRVVWECTGAEASPHQLPSYISAQPLLEASPLRFSSALFWNLCLGCPECGSLDKQTVWKDGRRCVTQWHRKLLRMRWIKYVGLTLTIWTCLRMGAIKVFRIGWV